METKNEKSNKEKSNFNTTDEQYSTDTLKSITNMSTNDNSLFKTNHNVELLNFKYEISVKPNNNNKNNNNKNDDTKNKEKKRKKVSQACEK